MYPLKLCLLGLALLLEVVASYDRPSGPVPNSWVIVLKDDIKKHPAEHAGWANSLHDKDPGDFLGVTAVFEYTNVGIKGYSGTFTDGVINTIKKDKDVDHVQQEWLVAPLEKPINPPHVSEEEIKEIHEINERLRKSHPGQKSIAHIPWQWRKPNNPILQYHDVARDEEIELAHGMNEQTDAPWGLTLISKADPGRYKFDRSAGEGTWIYVLDSGINLAHEDFEGRAEFGADATQLQMAKIEPEAQTVEHGTHVASIAAGRKYGVAKRARLVDVQVLREPLEEEYLGDIRVVAAGIEWAVTDIQVRNRVGKAVLNLSPGMNLPQHDDGCKSISKAMDRALEAGIHVVVGAGNNNTEVHLQCPANFKSAITVGAIDMNNHRAYKPPVDDSREWGSNFGKDIDIFAPGVDIKAAWGLSTGDSDSVLMSGSSMAASHVSGVIAYLIALEGPCAPKEMWEKIRKLSQKGKVEDTKGSPNRLLYNGA